MKNFRFLFLHLMIVLLRRTVKCSWSDSQRCYRDYVYVFMSSNIDAAEAEVTVSVTRFSMCEVNKPRVCAIHSHRDTHNMQDSYLNSIFAFTDTSPYSVLFKYTDLLLIYSSKIWQILWNSALYSKFHFYDWIPRFCPHFPHCRKS